MKFIPAVAVWGLVTTSFSPFANVFFAVHIRMPLHQVGTVFSISQLVQVGAVLCVPLVFRRWGLTKGILIAQLATSFCFVLLATSTRSFFCSAVYIALTAFQWMNEPGLYSLLMNIVPEDQRGGASASMSFTLSCAQLVAAALAGWGFTHLGYPAVLSAIAVAAVAAGLLLRRIPVHVADTAPTLEQPGPDVPLTQE
jgi:MFS family permease